MEAAFAACTAEGDFSRFDNDGDGDIDCVYFIYLDYYYDRCTTGSTDLMDSTSASLTPYSRFLLGWSDPEVLHYTPAERELRPFSTGGDVLTVSRDLEGSIFGEYYIVSLWAPVGGDVAEYCLGYPVLSTCGVTVYHVSGELKPGDVSFPVSSNALFYETNFLRMLRNGPEPEFTVIGDYATDDDLFRAGDSVTLYWDDGAPAMVLTVVSIEVEGEDAVATVTLTLP